MTTDTVLTDAQCLSIGSFGQSPIKRLDHSRAVEQAVLQSPEIQRLREDAARYRFLRHQNLDDGTDTAPWISAASTDDERWGLNGEIADSRIDAAMEKQP